MLKLQEKKKKKKSIYVVESGPYTTDTYFPWITENRTNHTTLGGGGDEKPE